MIFTTPRLDRQANGSFLVVLKIIWVVVNYSVKPFFLSRAPAASSLRPSRVRVPGSRAAAEQGSGLAASSLRPSRSMVSCTGQSSGRRAGVWSRSLKPSTFKVDGLVYRAVERPQSRAPGRQRKRVAEHGPAACARCACARASGPQLVVQAWTQRAVARSRCWRVPSTLTHVPLTHYTHASHLHSRHSQLQLTALAPTHTALCGTLPPPGAPHPSSAESAPITAAGTVAPRTH